MRAGGKGEGQEGGKGGRGRREGQHPQKLASAKEKARASAEAMAPAISEASQGGCMQGGRILNCQSSL